MRTEKEINDLKAKYADQLFTNPGVSGVGVERDQQGIPILTVHLDSLHPDAKASLPDEIEGYPIKYIVSGPFQKLPAIVETQGEE